LFLNKTYQLYFKDILEIKNRFKKLLAEYKKQNTKIAGYGAAAKTTTFSYFFELDKNTIEYIFDDNKIKQGKFTPGKKIPIINPKFIKIYKPDIIIILAWNYYKDIIKKNKNLGYKPKFLIPRYLKIKIVNKKFPALTIT